MVFCFLLCKDVYGQGTRGRPDPNGHRLNLFSIDACRLQIARAISAPIASTSSALGRATVANLPPPAHGAFLFGSNKGQRPVID